MTLQLAQQTQSAPGSSQDFRIPAPQPAAPAQPPSAAPVASIQQASPPGSSGLTGNDVTIGLAVLFVLTLISFFARNALRTNLINRKSRPSTASGAAWMLFAFMLSVSATLIFGTLGTYWTVPEFIFPMSALVLVTLILFINLYNSAAKGRR